MAQVLLRAGGSLVADVFCPLCTDERTIYGQCIKDEAGDCSYFVSCCDIMHNGLARTKLECNHPDIEKCNPYAETDL